jgi:ribonuclease HII
LKILLDAGLKAPTAAVNQSSHIKGDEKYVEIALASILAKVHRDAHMDRLGRSHKEYGWGENAGYGTSKHREGIQANGITKYHRRTYLKAFKLFDKAE